MIAAFSPLKPIEDLLTNLLEWFHSTAGLSWAWSIVALTVRSYRSGALCGARAQDAEPLLPVVAVQLAPATSKDTSAPSYATPSSVTSAETEVGARYWASIGPV